MNTNCDMQNFIYILFHYLSILMFYCVFNFCERIYARIIASGYISCSGSLMGILTNYTKQRQADLYRHSNDLLKEQTKCSNCFVTDMHSECNQFESQSWNCSTTFTQFCDGSLTTISKSDRISSFVRVNWIQNFIYFFSLLFLYTGLTISDSTQTFSI